MTKYKVFWCKRPRDDMCEPCYACRYAMGSGPVPLVSEAFGSVGRATATPILSMDGHSPT